MTTTDATKATPIGFVGLGNMGAPMVRCLAKAGHAVIAYDVRQGVAATLAGEAASGGRVRAAASLAEVGGAAEIVITMLPDSKIVRQAVMGDKPGAGLAATLRPGGIVVDMSSSYPLDTRKLADALAAQKIAVVDAPVSGGVGKAIAGTLAIMAGGTASAVDKVAPVLAAMGQVHRCGALGAGHAIKALNNYVSAAGLIATCEALVIAEQFGLDAAVVTHVINASTGRNNTTENKAGRYLIPRAYTSGFALALMEKDVGMACALARELGVDAEELAFVADYLARAAVALGRDADHTAVMALVADRVSSGKSKPKAKRGG